MEHKRTNRSNAGHERHMAMSMIKTRLRGTARQLKCPLYPRKADIRSPSRRLLCSQTCEGPFPLFGRLCHTLKKDGRALYRHSFTGTVNFPSPGLSRTSSSLHGERIVGWIKFSTRHAPERKRGNAQWICLPRRCSLAPTT